MGVTCGIVGLPNVGKSSLLNILSAGSAVSANFPFCTIEPNLGQVTMPDERLSNIAKLVDPEKIVPTTIPFVDIAGLVKGASQGEGLGNQFLAHIRSVNSIVHVIRCFENSDVIHVHSGIDPLFDKEIVEYELQRSDISLLERRREKIAKKAKIGDSEAKKEIGLIENALAKLSNQQFLDLLNLDEEEKKIVESWRLLTLKEVIYVANIDEATLVGAENPHLKALEEVAKKEGRMLLPICIKIEEELAALPPLDQADFLSMYGLKETSLIALVQSVYKMLKRITYFTAGEKEVRAWTIPMGTLAPQAAGVIHSDLEKNFIKVEVIKYKDFIEHQGREGCQKAGKLAIEGKDYTIKDGDILLFKCRN